MKPAMAGPGSPMLPIFYDQMFRHLKELKRKASEEERQGKDGEHFRTLYKRLARLEDHQAQTLNQIADDVERDVDGT